MSNPIDLRVERLKRLPLAPDDTWQGAIVKIPGWVTESDSLPFRPHAAVWISRKTRLAHIGQQALPASADLALALDALVEFAQSESKAGSLPGRLEVRDPGLAAHLQSQLTSLGIEVLTVDRLEGLDEFMTIMTTEMSGPGAASSLLEESGGDVERIRSFAEAAAAFFRARPWCHLDEHDLIHVESATPGGDLEWFTVMGAATMAYGLGFHPTKRDYEIVMRGHRPLRNGSTHWSVRFEPITDISFPDADLWEDHELPVADDQAYPDPSGFLLDPEAPRIRRPDAKRLTYLEALLRAVAASTEDELDSGRWAKRVTAFGKERTVKLALPNLLEPERSADADSEMPDRRVMEKTLRSLSKLTQDKEFGSLDEMNAFLREQMAHGQPPEVPPETDEERAQELVYQALEARGRRQIKLANEALQIDPDCADALVLLAERMPDSERKTDLYRQGMVAGERALGPKPFEEDVGHFWGMLETRPYMRARFGLAQCLEAAGQVDESIHHYRELLRLNPGDNQGVRYLLASCLIREARDEEAEVFLDEHEDDGMAFIPWGRTLVAFRREGASEHAAGRLEAAMKRNKFVSRLLLGLDEPPEELPNHYRPGGEDEAALYCDAQLEAWESTPGAIEWLRDQVREGKRRRRETRKKGKQKGAVRRSKRGRG